jgi:hypothetical protein
MPILLGLRVLYIARDEKPSPTTRTGHSAPTRQFFCLQV